MTTTSQWHHGKHDCLLPRFGGSGTQPIALPYSRTQKKAVVQVAYDGISWWYNGIAWSPTPNEQVGPLQELWDARVVVNTAEERTALLALLGPDLDCIVLDSWFEDAPCGGDLAARVQQLLARMAHCQQVLRVDFSEHNTILASWRHRNLRRIKRDWPAELQGTHLWLQSIDDRPWQEARMAYDTRDLAGAVLDIRSAYASAIQAMPFPKPGVPWTELRAGQRHPDALHCIVWTPTDAIGRFYHPFWYNVKGVRGQPGYQLGDEMHGWVLDEDLAWLSRHGTVLGVYQSVAPGAMTPHPLQGSVAKWQDFLDHESNPGYRGLHKIRLVSAHSWTWQPRTTTLVADVRSLNRYALEQYSSRVAGRIGGLHVSVDPTLGLVAEGNSEDSGWYTPVAWVRLKLRSHMLRRVEHALDCGLDIAYISVDGFHVRGSSQEAIEACHHAFVDTLAPWFQWRIDKTFLKGIWFRPGSYALQDHNGIWQPTNLPELITGRDWNLWCQTRGVLDARKEVGYWRRANNPVRWEQYPSISLNAQRVYRGIVRRELHR